MKWNSITDVLPEDMETVLLYDEIKGISIGHYLSSTDCFIRYIDGLKLEEVSSWMPLPLVPNPISAAIHSLKHKGRIGKAKI